VVLAFFGHNHFIGIEHLTESEVEEFRRKCEDAVRRHDTRQGRQDRKKQPVKA